MGPSPHEELGPEQPPDETTRSQDDLSAKGESPSPARGGQAMDHVLPEGWKFSCEGTQRPESAPHQLPGDETVMEVEVTDQVLISAESQLKEQRFGLSAVNSECSMMEAQSSQPDSSLSADPISAKDLGQPGRAAVESADMAAPAGCSGPPPPPPEGQVGHQAEGACPSLTSALKELHQLLVASYKKASWPQSLDQPRTFPEEDAAFQEERGCGRDIRDVELSSPEGVPACPGAGASAGEWLSGAGAEDGQEALEPPDSLLIQEPLGWDSSIVRRSSAASQPPPCGEPGVPVSSDATEPAALHICSPEMDSAPSRPPLFSSVDIAQITRAGFTPQEASEALEQAGGNVDLALLILLAKNIVVPT
uniref:Uncharacterized protein n=1 Tax=Sphaerodactylus townsendi TaxID=933632 RepID=A0ACB8EEE4_9SAUR